MDPKNLSYLQKPIDPNFKSFQSITKWGQLILGPPGSGKTTYCKALSKLMPELLNNKREVCWVNLDPANDILSDHITATTDSLNPDQNDLSNITPSIDISELVTLEDVMNQTGLGPNGGLLHCMDILLENFDWLQEKLFQAHAQNPHVYFLFDIPGQVELSTVSHSSLKTIISKLTDSKTFDLRLCAVHLIDSVYCNETFKFFSGVMTSLSTMIHMELPHINVLSKLDLAQKLDENFNLEFYSNVVDLEHLVDDFESKFLNSSEENQPFRKQILKQVKLLSRLSSVIEDYSLVRYIPMSITSSESIEKVIQSCDVANGYFSVEGGAISSAMQLPDGYEDDYLRRMEEQFLS